MKHILLSLTLTLGFIVCRSQVGDTKSKIVSDNPGVEFMSGVEDGVKYIAYKTDNYSNEIGRYIMVYMYYLNSKDICYKFSVMQPIQKIEEMMKLLDSYGDRIETMKWKIKDDGTIVTLTTYKELLIVSWQ